MLAILAVILVTAYQAYWLTDIYATLQHNLQKDIAEAMRASDFAEITRRVELLRNQGIGGKMDITVGADSHGEQVEVGNECQSPQERDRLHCKQRDSSVLANRSSKGSPNSSQPFADFASALSDEEAVRRVGLYMQRGIHDGRKEVKVTDRGMGIAKEQQQFIFDKFYRVPHGNLHQVKGYGLGLFYVRSMMERFGGSVVVKSEENVGSCFKLTWPATPSS